jgi:hypothetical protein
MDKFNWYFRQKVEEGEMDQIFDYAESADRNLASDHGLTGIQSGLVVAPAGPSDLTVDISAGTAYSKSGERLRFPALSNVDVSTDELGNPTAVIGPGNERVLAIFLSFVRNESEPRTDGNGDPINFRLEEGTKIRVVSGVEAVAPAPAPAPDSNDILLADIRLSFGTVAITVGEIETGRREWAISFSGTNITLTDGTPAAGINSLALALDAITRSVTIPCSKSVGAVSGTIGVSDNGRTLVGAATPNAINVPLECLNAGDRILSVTARYDKGTAATASMRLLEFSPIRTDTPSVSKNSAAAAGFQNITLDQSDDSVWFGEPDNTREVLDGYTYWCEMTDGDNGDIFISVTVTYITSSV